MNRPQTGSQKPSRPEIIKPKSSQRYASLLRLLRPIYRKYRLRLLLGFLALLAVDFLTLTIPRYLKQGVDSLTQGSATSSSLMLTGGYIILTGVFILLFRFSWRTLIIGFSRRLEKILRDQLYKHILKMDRPFFDRHSTGDLMAHSSNDLSAVQMACGMGMVAAADALVMSMAALFFMANISLTLTLIALIPMPLLALCTWKLSGKLHTRFDRVQEQFSLLTEFARNTMVSIRLIKGYTREQRQCSDFDDLGREYVQANLKVAIIHGLLFPISTMVGNLGMLLTLYFGGRLVISNAITLGDFVAFITYLYMLIWPIMAVGWVTNLAQRGITSLTRIQRLLDAVPLLPDSIAVANEPVIDSLTFTCQNLNFTYPNAKVPALIGVNLEVRAGIIGVAGKTGSGKSTLCMLLARQYPLPDNMLLFSGHDVNRFSPATIRKQISYVSPQPVLLSGTVAENISLAVPDASEKAIEEAAQLAGIHDEIMAMETRYQTRIGELGVRLSGGQKQRIGIARALLANRPILILDDALSSLDVETEQEVFRSIRSRVSILLIASHRLNILARTERIILFDQGRVIAQGSHEELLEKSPFYQAMARKQQGGGSKIALTKKHA